MGQHIAALLSTLPAFRRRSRQRAENLSSTHGNISISLAQQHLGMMLAATPRSHMPA